MGVHCLGGDDGGSTQQGSPRSILLWLQDTIRGLESSADAQTERRPAAGQQQTVSPVGGFEPGQGSQCDGANGRGNPKSLTEIVSQDLVFPYLGFSRSLSLPGFVLSTEARLPSVDGGTGETFSRNGVAPPGSQPDATVDPLRAIPRQVADYLLEIYISRVMSSYPIFHEPWLRACHAAVIYQTATEKGPAVQDGPYERYTISLLMAVALSTAARSNREQANDLAFKLFRNALQYIPDVTTNDFAGLQALVLLHSYAIMNPSAANLYFLGGYTMQACIDMGLHREDADDPVPSTNLLAQDIRRRVFWTAWEMDVSCGAGLSRPFALLQKQITTGFPSDLEDSAIHRDRIDRAGRRSKFICNQVRTFRLIETEVISVLFHDHPFPRSRPSFDPWAADLESRMTTWRLDIRHQALANPDPLLAVQWEEMVLFAEIATPLIVLSLYRPSPRIKSPPVDHLLRAFEASCQVVRGYNRQAGAAFGSPKFTFQPCHHVFASAMVYLHCLRTCPGALRRHYSDAEVREGMAAFADFFAATAERWPASVKCAEEYDRHLQPLKERYFEPEPVELAAALVGMPPPAGVPPDEGIGVAELGGAHDFGHFDDLMPASGFLGYEDFVMDPLGGTGGGGDDGVVDWTAQGLTYLDWADHFDLEGVGEI